MERRSKIEMKSHSKAGFTLIELMVVLAIIGILAATAVPMHSTYRQRAYGSEALLMMKKLLEAQLVYYLEHNKFFPESGQVIFVPGNASQDASEIQQISDALKITIPAGHRLDYYIRAYPATAEESCTIIIQAAFSLFSDQSKALLGTATKTGSVEFRPTGGAG